MTKPVPERPYFNEWLDSLEQTITKQAEIVGLLEHGATVGTAREFVLENVLRTLLPSAVHYGSGIIVDRYGKRSSQVDIIVYDPRFPKFEVRPGLGTYLAEGVIATVEVKSMLSRKELHLALDNCKSVMALASHAPPEDLARGIVRIRATQGVNHRDAEQALKSALQIHTYILGFRGYRTAKALCDAIESWFVDSGRPGIPNLPFLPRAIVAEHSLALACDHWMQIRPEPGPHAPPMQPGTQLLMSVSTTPLRFGMFAIHLIHAVMERLGAVHHGEQVRLDAGLIPALVQYANDLRGPRHHWVTNRPEGEDLDRQT